MLRLRRFLLALVLVVATAGCNVATDVVLDVERDGSGEVRVLAVLDRAAAARLGNLDRALALDDVRAAGWRVVGPLRTDDGGARVELRKDFATPAQGEAVLVEVFGADVVGTPVIDQHRSFVKTRTTVRAVVDLRRGVEAFSDDGLAARLGSPLGVEPEALAREAGRPLAEVIELELRASVPGGSATVEPELGRTVPIRVDAERWNTGSLLAWSVAAAAGAAAVVTGLRTRRRPSADPSPDAPEASP